MPRPTPALAAIREKDVEDILSPTSFVADSKSLYGDPDAPLPIPSNQPGSNTGQGQTPARRPVGADARSLDPDSPQAPRARATRKARRAREGEGEGELGTGTGTGAGGPTPTSTPGKVVTLKGILTTN